MNTHNTHLQPYFFIRSNGRYIRVAFSDIMYVEGYRNYIKLVTEKKIYIVLITMKQILNALPSHSFCRIHRSYIISLNHITAFDSERVFISDKEFPMGIQYRPYLQQKVKILVNEIREKDKVKSGIWKINDLIVQEN